VICVLLRKPHGQCRRAHPPNHGSISRQGQTVYGYGTSVNSFFAVTACAPVLLQQSAGSLWHSGMPAKQEMGPTLCYIPPSILARSSLQWDCDNVAIYFPVFKVRISSGTCCTNVAPAKVAVQVPSKRLWYSELCALIPSLLPFTAHILGLHSDIDDAW
jgi:hypothetical protein